MQSTCKQRNQLWLVQNHSHMGPIARAKLNRSVTMSLSNTWLLRFHIQPPHKPKEPTLNTWTPSFTKGETRVGAIWLKVFPGWTNRKRNRAWVEPNLSRNTVIPTWAKPQIFHQVQVQLDLNPLRSGWADSSGFYNDNTNYSITTHRKIQSFITLWRNLSILTIMTTICGPWKESRKRWNSFLSLDPS